VRLGVLDLGSNTVHLLLVDAHYGAAPVPASKMKMNLRLSEHLQADGSVEPAAVDQLLDFVSKGLKLAEDKGATEIMAFATSAIREATNGDDVLRRLHDESGLEIQVLSGEDEARMTFLAARRWFGWSSGRILLLDIGGGSLEMASGTDEEPDTAVSVPLGAGRMTRDFLHGDPPSPEMVRELRRHARARIAEVVGRVRRHGEAQVAVATSKTFKQLARIGGAAPSSEGMHAHRVLRIEDLREIVPKLAGMTVAERSKIPGVSEGRSAQMVAGAVVAEAAMDLFELEELVVCPWALREGLILRRLDGLPL
jgi:exopolyphosphatase/guanosine-5'-triphosphate,3'-diphosphate pyrophosphatase